ncbi:hypothetical protein BHE74_00018989 [Ensete ventricosum]|nr:hypothetical protein GW17_00039064 [Ensete ventricosum]RWW73160.1 hypothetical protein BHE74_00018989 [Ensete ventricosum]RZS07711.1 hypothetical protein BHM03_00038590 [Ensete ventricosum]
MALDVSLLAQMLKGYEEGEQKRELVTRDLLGGGRAVLGSAEVDLELRVPAGWERRLDLLKRHHDPVPGHRHDLNLTLPPRSSATLFLEQWAAATPLGHRSVCTLEKVKSALERAGREERPPAARGPDSSPSPPSWSIATSSSMAADRGEDGRGPESLPAAMAVAGCPVCLLYVLVSVVDPRCPRCAAHVPIHNEPKKRPKFDLNSPTQIDDGVDDLN